MRKPLNWLISTAFTFGGVVLLVASPTLADNPANPASADQKVAADQQALALPAGAKMTEEPKVADLTKPIAEVTEAAMTKKGFGDIVERFVKQDRDRIGDFAKGNFDQLNGRVDQLEKVWNDKYHQKFTIDRDRIFADAKAIQGEIEDPAAFVQNWPANAAPGMANAQQARGNAGLDEQTQKQGDIDKGRNVGLVRLPGRDGLPALDVSVVHEITGWKIDLPNYRTGQQIHDDLLKQLTALGENSERWPATPDDAKRVFAHRVLMAIYGVEAPAPKG